MGSTPNLVHGILSSSLRRSQGNDQIWKNSINNVYVHLGGEKHQKGRDQEAENNGSLNTGKGGKFGYMELGRGRKLDLAKPLWSPEQEARQPTASRPTADLGCPSAFDTFPIVLGVFSGGICGYSTYPEIIGGFNITSRVYMELLTFIVIFTSLYYINSLW